MFNMKDFAIQLLMNNPRVANNPQIQNYIQVIQSGDNAKGAEIANNICQSYGVTPEQGLQQARQFFRL